MIRKATLKDRDAIAAIDRLSFSGNKPEGVAEKWVESHLSRQHDQYHMYLFEVDGMAQGYIGWEMQGGFAREVPILELQKLAVHPNARGKGVGTALVNGSFEMMKEWIGNAHPDATEMRVVVWTRKDNEKAQSIYLGICNEGAKGERNMYVGSDEVMLRGTYELH